MFVFLVNYLGCNMEDVLDLREGCMWEMGGGFGDI